MASANPTGYFNTQTPAQPGGIIAGVQATPAPTAAPTIAPTLAPTAAPTPAPSAPPVDYTNDLNNLYQKDLNRTGDKAGLDFWKAQLTAGNTNLAGVEQGILNSDEYKSLHPAPAPVSASQPAVLGSPTQWNVTPNQTVAGQMQGLIDPNNPYYQQWATAGAQDAAARGFTGNSSIRDTAILDSVMRGATPIATADASTYAKAAGYNADTSNQFAVNNFNAANQLNLANLSASTQRYVADQSAATQKAIQQMSNASQATISAAHDANALLIQNNQAAANAYAQYVQAVASIDQQPGMDEAAKQTAITTQTQIFNNAIAGLRGSNAGVPDVSSPLDITHNASAESKTDPAALAAAKAAGVNVTGILSF
jgi:hypothetical protein